MLSDYLIRKILGCWSESENGTPHHPHLITEGSTPRPTRCPARPLYARLSHERQSMGHRVHMTLPESTHTIRSTARQPTKQFVEGGRALRKNNMSVDLKQHVVTDVTTGPRPPPPPITRLSLNWLYCGHRIYVRCTHLTRFLSEILSMLNKIVFYTLYCI